LRKPLDVAAERLAQREKLRPRHTRQSCVGARQGRDRRVRIAHDLQLAAASVNNSSTS